MTPKTDLGFKDIRGVLVAAEFRLTIWFGVFCVTLFVFVENSEVKKSSLGSGSFCLFLARIESSSCLLSSVKGPAPLLALRP